MEDGSEAPYHAVALMDLPDEVLAHILSYLPLLDLYNMRPVSKDGNGKKHFWARVATERAMLSPHVQLRLLSCTTLSHPLNYSHAY